MHLAFVCHSYAPGLSAEEVLRAHFTTVDWAGALHRAGIQVSVIYRFHTDHRFEQEGVRYYFLGAHGPAQVRNRHLAYGFHRRVAELVQAEGIDVIHTHNLFAFGPHFMLRRCVRQIPILVQDHSGATRLKHPRLYRLGLRRMNAYMFAAAGQEDPWVTRGVIDRARCVFVMENASPFVYQARPLARRQTGMHGAPVVLWVGNLNPNKDPHTVLRAFDRLLEHYPAARLYMIYRFGDLEAEVQDMIARHPRLKRNVTLLGRLPREHLEVHYNSADYLVAASHKEGSGYAVIEAMSCGVVPVLSNIASFSALTHQGQVGALFEVGRPEGVFEALMTCLKTPPAEASAQVLAHYQAHFSFEALAAQAKAIYRQLIDQHVLP